jgi:hypothetical protein
LIHDENRYSTGGPQIDSEFHWGDKLVWLFGHVGVRSSMGKTSPYQSWCNYRGCLSLRLQSLWNLVKQDPVLRTTWLSCSVGLKPWCPALAMRVVTGPSERSVQSGTVDLTDLKHCLNTRRTEPLLMKAAVNNCFWSPPTKKICPPHKKKHNVRISSNPASPSFNGVLP